MKKILWLGMLTISMLMADAGLKDGKYSWTVGDSEASLTVSKVKGNQYTLEGYSFYNTGGKYGPNMGDLKFSASLDNGKMLYTSYDYKFILTLNNDGSFDVVEKGTIPFGMNVSFAGHYNLEELPKR